MPARPYLARVAGRVTEVLATVVGGTAAQGGHIVALDDTGRLHTSLMPTGIGADTHAGIASGALSAGDFVTVTDQGIVRASAAATGGQPADGFVKVASTNGTSALVYFEGTNDALSGLTVGARYYLSDATPGGLTTNPVSGTGKLHQYLGKAVTSTSLTFEGDDAIVLA